MRVLFIGDVVGKTGRDTLNKYLAQLQKQYQIDFTIVNGENAAHGKGITQKIYEGFINQGVDVVTMGNHTYSKDVILKFIMDAERLIRPGNQDMDKPGRSAIVIPWKNIRVGVYNLSGQVFMENVAMSPIKMMEKLLAEYPAEIKIVDFHGEATGEKASFLHTYYSQLSLVVGTHTHIQTADEMIYHGCGFITDVGMCGAYDSIIGRDTNEVLEHLLTDKKTHFIPGSTPGILCGLVASIDEKTGRMTAIQRIQLRPQITD